jgi:hypothetical protein
MINEITLISQYFPPENGAAAERMGSVAHYLHKYCELEIVTAQPLHMMLTGSKQQSEYPFKIVRLPHKKKSSKSKYMRLMHEISFALKATKYLYQRAGRSLLLFTTPSPFLALVALLFKKYTNRCYVLDIRDLYPEVIADVGIVSKNNPIYILASSVMNLAYKNASLLSFVNKKWSDHMINSNPNSLYLPNGISDEKTRVTGSNQRENVIFYSGNFGQMYNFSPVLIIAQKLQQSSDPQLKDVRIVLIGDGVQGDWIKQEIQQMKLRNIEIIGPYTKSEVSEILKTGKIGIVSLQLEAASLRGAVPNKLYDYLECGLRTIAIIPETISSDILSTGLITIHTNIDYDRILDDIKENITNYKYQPISKELFPFLYRSYHLKKLKRLIENID